MVSSQLLVSCVYCSRIRKQANVQTLLIHVDEVAPLNRVELDVEHASVWTRMKRTGVPHSVSL